MPTPLGPAVTVPPLEDLLALFRRTCSSRCFGKGGFDFRNQAERENTPSKTITIYLQVSRSHIGSPWSGIDASPGF